MKPIHGLALMLLCAALPGVPASAADPDTVETAMLSAEPLSADPLRIQMLGAAASATAPESLSLDAVMPNRQDAKEAAPKTIKTMGEPVVSSTATVEPSPIKDAVRARLTDSFPLAGKQKPNERNALATYYAEPGSRILWVDEDGLSARGKAAIAEIERADDYGLESADYKLPDMTGFDRSAAGAIEQLADAEIAISSAVLAYARDARGGRITPARISRNLDPTLVLPKPDEVIHSIAYRSDPAAYLRSFQPQHEQFERLRKKLIALRGGSATEEDSAPAVQIPAGPMLRHGDADPQVALLRKRLGLSQGDDPELFDEALADAVKSFQTAHNTSADGVVGPGTRRLLNNPHLRNTGSPADIKKILLNMERWRWLPQDRGEFYVTVNIPAFMLRVVKDDETIHTTRVVVGKTKTPTPIFSNNMKSVVFGPYWNVPNSIKTGEIRPYIRPYNAGWYGRRWDTRVLQQHELRIKYNGKEVNPQAIDWARVDVRKLHFYQPPSPKNVLGRVKFVFPNKHDVYMHDTQDKHFFKRSVRAESHGCMRVQNPDDFAAVLLKHDRNWSASKTQHAFDTGYDKHVPLSSPIPVYVTYFTMWVNEDGSTKTYRDLYGHDRRMSASLFKKGRNYAARKRPATVNKGRRADTAQKPYSARFARNAY